MQKKRKAQTEAPASPVQSLRKIFPGKTSGEFRTAFQQLKKDVQNFQKEFSGKIADQDGAGLLKAFRDLENILEQSQKIRSYVDIRSYTVEKSPAWTKSTKKRLNTLLRDTMFFASEVVELPEYELLDRMAEEPKLSQYTPWLRQTRSYNGAVFDTDSERYIHDQMHTHHDIKNIWAELAAPLDGDGRNLFQTLFADKDQTARHKAYADAADASTEDEDILLQLLSNRMRGHDTFASLRGFNTPEDAFISFSQTSPDILEAMQDGLAEKVADLSSKFYTRKAQQADLPRLHPADMLHIKTPEISKNSWEQHVLPHLEKLYPDHKDTPTVMDSDIGKKMCSPYTPFKLFTPPGDVGSYLCIDGDFPALTTMLYTAHSFGTEAQRSASGKKNSYLTDKALPAFQKVSGYMAEHAALDQLIKNERDLEKRRDLMEYQIERHLQSLALHLSLTEFDQNIRKTVDKHGAFSAEDAQKTWKSAMQHFFGPAVDYDEAGTDMLWSQWPSTFSDTTSLYQDILGVSLATQLYKDYSKTRDKEGFVEKFSAFLEAGNTKQGKPLFKALDIDLDDAKMWKNSIALLEDRFKSLQNLDKRIAIEKDAKQKRKQNPKNNGPK